MAIVSVPGLELPPNIQMDAAPTYGTATVNVAGDKMGAVLRAPKTGLIRRIGFRTGTVTAASDVDVRVETVVGSVPSGTLWAANTNGAVASASVVANTFIFATLTANASVTAGDLIGISCVTSGTPNFQFTILSGAASDVGLMPYAANGGSGTYSADTTLPIFAIEYSDGSYAYTPYVLPWSAINTHTFNSGSTPDEIALKFQLPAPVRVHGAWFAGDLDNSADIVLYDSGGSALATASLTSNGRASTSGRSPYYLIFSSTVTLTAGADYYLAAKPGASDISIYSVDVPSAAALDQMGGGQDFLYSERTNAGAWSDTTTRQPLMGLLIDGIDDGASAGTTNIFVVSD